jgi:hypothetical protein
MGPFLKISHEKLRRWRSSKDSPDFVKFVQALSDDFDNLGASMIRSRAAQGKKPTAEQIARAEQRVLRTAQKYGDQAAADDYSDKQEGHLLGAAYRYAELLRRAGVKK